MLHKERLNDKTMHGRDGNTHTHTRTQTLIERNK